MHLVERVWTTITYVVSFLTLSPINEPSSGQQIPLLLSPSVPHDGQLRGPIFKPPGGRPTGPGSDFTCDYSQMPGFSSCSTPDNRSCWLRNDKTGFEYDINTNYEDTNLTPVGIHRTYYLNITDKGYNADGLDFPYGKLFNATYPGPWIQACWGDNVTVIVQNKLKHNGTSIHWHGIRQWLTMHMDGVNGVTQCPIAPGDSFNYTFRAMQYGSSWYHSHYSVQYADGAVGPLTLHGPTSEPYDEPKLPLLMTDWGHNSAFNASFVGLTDKSILLNGLGNVTRYNNGVKAKQKIPDPYTITFEPPRGSRPKRYLLRLINTSFDSTFVFSIDGHMLQIVGADFVPIHGYYNTSVLVGIGQRYHVIVTAVDNPKVENYWIRTYKADCFRFTQSQASEGYETTGILRYGTSQALPATSPWPVGTNVSLDCSDETFSSLKPVLPWQVGKASNDPLGGVGENFTVQLGSGSSIYPLAAFSMGAADFNPLRIDYGDPTFLHLNNTGKWNPLWVVIPENYTDTDWVYFALQGVKITGRTTGAHPIHLHGHDFAILQQIGGAVFPQKLNLTLTNPPRRDVVLLPQDGYVVIAFKTDNPGTWLVHCHIADHASAGLAMQIVERQSAAATIWPSLNNSRALQTAKKGCETWNDWVGRCTNWWPGDGSTCPAGELGFAPDSGI